MSSKLSALTDLAGGQVPTDLAYIDDLSAGVNGSKKSSLNDLISIITKNITDGALRFQNFAAPSLSASNQGAIYYDSTINRLLLSENAGPFMPLRQNMYLDFNSPTTVANTTTETALLGAADDGSTKIVTPAIVRVNRTFRLSFYGAAGWTNAVPTLTIRLKLVGGVTVTVQSWTPVLPATATSSAWRLDLFATIITAGAGGAITIHPSAFEFSNDTQGATQWSGRGTGGPTAIDFSVNQTWELTVQWGTANASNTFTYSFANIDIVR